MFIYEDVDTGTEGGQRLSDIATPLAQYMQNAQRVVWTLKAERAIRRICTSLGEA